jgi:hypothetical protein
MHAALVEDPWEYNGLLNGRPVRVLLDSGAAANFLAAKVAEMSLPLKDIEEDGVGFARMPDGTRCDCKATKLLDLRIGGHRERIAFNVTTLEEHEVILGQGWLRWHNPTMHWRDGRAVMKRGHKEVTIYPSARGHSPVVDADLVSGSIPLSAMQFAKALKRGEDAFVALLRPVDRDRLEDGSPHLGGAGTHHAGQGPRLASAGDHAESGGPHCGSAKGPTGKGAPPPRQVGDAEVRPRNTRTAGPKRLEVPDGVPNDLAAVLRSFEDVFPDALPAGLPPAREVDHAIELEPGALPPSRPTYRMSFHELEELERQLREYVVTGGSGRVSRRMGRRSSL